MASSEGLAGIVVGDSGISTVGQGLGLSYRGHSIEELSSYCSFEQVAYLLLEGSLPTGEQLQDFTKKMNKEANNIEGLKPVLREMPCDLDPMDAIHAIVMLASSSLPECSEFSNQKAVALRILAVLTPCLLFWYHRAKSGLETDVRVQDGESIAAQFLRLLKLKPASKEEIRALDVCLILYAEHEFNASTFAARVCASTLSDAYSCVAAAIGTLKGRLHGGANEASSAYLQKLKSISDADKFLDENFKNKHLIMGFGHRVYKKGDPRHPIVREVSAALSRGPQGMPALQKLGEHIERRMVEEKKIPPNLDFFASILFTQLRIPRDLATPVFVLSRTSGWLAHIIEQRSKNKLIRPLSKYTGPVNRPLPPYIMQPKL